ncbi:MAG: diaminopimelate dehydrogenase [Tissierellia bacterium]|nr:diaminopimelate dehydrogenase [Tissierellia bacterium]
MIRIGIVGYGNLGKAAEKCVNDMQDMELVAVFSRREIKCATVPVYSYEQLLKRKIELDVLLLCLGSATDIPEYAPRLAKLYNTVDVYDNHGKLPEYRAEMNNIAKENRHSSIVAVGWDPGLFSLQRTMASAILPKSIPTTFWGSGVSQGHTDAIKRIPGVEQAVQYTVPKPEALDAIVSGKSCDIPATSRHYRQCYVVCDERECSRIEETITTMPDYFADYDTRVEFITKEEFVKHSEAMPHGGQVISADFSTNAPQIYKFELELGSNPAFTASVMVAYARAAHSLWKNEDYGAKTILEIPPCLISPMSIEDMVNNYL